uniref:Uncharacterized protein n=1 Tax=Operophtera brumata cypovirus 18 TaxID=352244 RepID=Q30C73_9REOV|nr:unknown [Operophtera brumata cypovirus 18]
MLQQPTGGYTTLERFNYTIRHDDRNATPTEFLQLITFEPTESEIVSKVIPQPEDHLPNPGNIPGNVYIEDSIAQALFSINAQNVSSHSYFSRISVLATPNTSARLGVDGVLYNSEVPNVEFYSQEAVAKFASVYAKLGNAATPRYRSDMIDIYSHVGLELAGTAQERIDGRMPVKRARFEPWEGSLIAVSRDVAGWKLLPFLIDLCTLEGNRLEEFKTRTRDVFRAMLFVISTAVAANAVNRKVGNQVNRVIEYIGVNSMRTAGRTATITYDLSRHEFVAKFLQLTFNRWNSIPSIFAVDRDMSTPKPPTSKDATTMLTRHNEYITKDVRHLPPIAIAQLKHEMMMHSHDVHSMDVDGSVKQMVERETVARMEQLDKLNPVWISEKEGSGASVSTIEQTSSHNQVYKRNQDEHAHSDIEDDNELASTGFGSTVGSDGKM